MKIKVKFDAEATLRAFERAPANTNRVYRKAMLESCKLVQQGAREVHKFKPNTGELARSVSYRVNKYNDGVVYLSEKIAPYGKFVHEGTKPHDIFPNKHKMLRFATSPNTALFGGGRFWRFHEGGFTYAFGVHHPGTKADRFLYKSAWRNQDEINNIFGRYTQKAIEEAGL